MTIKITAADYVATREFIKDALSDGIAFEEETVQKAFNVLVNAKVVA